ncbi:unnamed protein product [Sphagnum balticum]
MGCSDVIALLRLQPTSQASTSLLLLVLLLAAHLVALMNCQSDSEFGTFNYDTVDEAALDQQQSDSGAIKGVAFAAQTPSDNYVDDNISFSFAVESSTAGDHVYGEALELPVRNADPTSFPGQEYYSFAAEETSSAAGDVFLAADEAPVLSIDEIQLVNATGESFDADPTVSLRAAWGGCGTGNPVDDCWRCDPNWASHRQSLANCAIGFGRNAIGGKNGRIYVVTSPADDDVANPRPGTLRYALTRLEPLWIIFARSMTIRLKNEGMMTSYKTLDGRGVVVHITGGAGLTLQYVNHIIIHNIYIHDIVATGPARVMSSAAHVGERGRADGDAISIFTGNNIWIDHCFLAKAADGLIDAIRGSTLITISNNYFMNHDKVMLMGAHPSDTMDRNMQVTVAFNKFGPGLIQRLPRCRFGHFHIVNNDYTSGWGIYAMGGSEAPTILSEGNHFYPAGGPKQVTKRISDGGSSYGGPNSWNWKSVGDVFLGGSYFLQSGATSAASPLYAKAFSFTARPGTLVPQMTSGAGPLVCGSGRHC